MVDRKELKIHKIDNMSREQLESRLQELVLQNQIILGTAEEVKDDKTIENQSDPK